jgi:hypothetical protein
MTTANNDDVAIAKYLRKRLESLRGCDAEVESRLSLDKIKFINAYDDEDTCNKYLSHIDKSVLNTFRYSMLIAVCTFLEESFKFLCDRSVTDYGKKLDAYRGTWLARHRRLLADHTSVDVAAIKKHLDEMEEFVQVRNCIAHAWGKLDGCRNKRQLHEIVKRADYFGLWKDGFLYVDDQAVPTAVIASGHIVNKLLQDLLGLPGHCVY